MRYGQIKDGESFKINLKQALLLQCCECGLVHETTFKVEGNELEIKMRQHRSETRKVRKRVKKRKPKI